MKKILQIVALVVMVGGIVFLWHHTENNKSKAKTAEQPRKEDAHKSIIELADKYNAIINWEESLNKRNFLLPVFTIHLQDALLHEDNRPVLLFAEIKDVERKDNSYTVHFSPSSWTYPHIEFFLDCSDEQVIKITQQQNEYGDNYAVIVAINKVKRLAFEVTSAIVGGYGDDAYGEIEIDTSDTFIATGHCIDLLPLKDYYDYDFYPEDEGE